MGRMTSALKKAAMEKISRIEKHPLISHQFIARKTVDSKVDPHIVTFYEGSSTVAEQYRILRTNIQTMNKEKGTKVITITSSIHSEGKTVTAINLAILLAQELDNKSVLLIDGDLRKGKIKGYLGLEPKMGLSNILNNGLSLDDSLLDIGVPNLTILTAGDVPKNPSELLSSWKMKELLGMLKKRFEYIIIDTPPVISITDPGPIGAQTDGVVMVVQAGRTQKGVIEHATELLRQAQAKVLGFVLTNVQYHIPEYIYRYVQTANS